MLRLSENIIIRLDSNFEVGKDDSSKTSGYTGGVINLVEQIKQNTKHHQIDFDEEERYSAVIFLDYIFDKPAFGIRLYDLEDYDNPCPKYFVDNASEISKKLEAEVNTFIDEINNLKETFAVYDITSGNGRVMIENGRIYAPIYNLKDKTYIELPKIEQRIFTIRDVADSVIDLYDRFITKNK